MKGLINCQIIEYGDQLFTSENSGKSVFESIVGEFSLSTKAMFSYSLKGVVYAVITISIILCT